MLDTVTNCLDDLLSELNPVEEAILNGRLWSSQSRILEEIGDAHGLTREHVRQRQSELQEKIESCIGSEVKDVATRLALELDSIDSYSKVELLAQQIAPQADARVRRALIYSMIHIAGYKYLDGAIVSKRALACVSQLKEVARAEADSCGLITREKLIERFPEELLRPHFDWICRQCGLHDMFGMLALRSTRKAKLKAALVSLGRPATRPELAEMCGLTNKIASAALSNISEIVRISRTQWALRDWGLHEYRGIVEEIVDYIRCEGEIAAVEPIIEDIAQRFDVKRWSVRAYMQTPKFHMHDGMIRLAKQTSPTMRPLADVVHGFDDKERPYWTFLVLERYFRGYSVVGVPFEIAEYLGCAPDDATTLEISNLVGCHDLTIQWYLSSTTKASIGFVRDALARLNLSVGQLARLTLLPEGKVELNWHPASARDR